MNLYRTSDSGLVSVQPLDPTETDGLAGALLRGSGGALGDDDVLFVTTAVGDGTATALGLDAAGDIVVDGAADGEVGSESVTNTLQSASAVAESAYDALDDRFEGEGSLQAAHADYFDREPLAPEAFNDDQRVRLLGTAFDPDALDLASFLSDRELTVTPVRVEAFGDPASEKFLVRFETVDGETDDSEASEAAGDDAPEHWVAGGDDGSSAAADADENADEQTSTDRNGADETAQESTPSDETDEADGKTADESGEAEATDEPLELPVLLEAVSEGLQERLVGTFDADPAAMISVERGTELVVRPDHPAYAGGVLRYRLRTQPDGVVEFEVNIYGGSEAEKEQMRAVIRENEDAIEEELGYTVSDRYDGFFADREFAHLGQVAAAEIVDEFDRLVRLFHPRVMRA